MRKYLFIFTLLALALSACRVETNVTMDIAEDGSGTIGFEVGMDEEFRDLMEQSGGSIDDLFGSLPEFGTEDVVPTDRVDGDMTYVGVETAVDDFSEFDVTAGQAGDFFSAFSYEFDRKSAALTATLSAGDAVGDPSDLPFDPSALTGDLFSMNVVISMPGTVVEHNADEVLGDGTLVWEIPLSGELDIFAKSTYGGTSVSWFVWILGLVLFVGVVAAITATIISRKESRKAVEEAAQRSSQELYVPLEPTDEPAGGTAGGAATDDADAAPADDAPQGDAGADDGEDVGDESDGDQPEST